LPWQVAQDKPGNPDLLAQKAQKVQKGLPEQQPVQLI
jgi:hypothetical protein